MVVSIPFSMNAPNGILYSNLVDFKSLTDVSCKGGSCRDVVAASQSFVKKTDKTLPYGALNTKPDRHKKKRRYEGV